MIKAVMGVGAQTHIVIGLSRLNCERLLDNQPISFDGASVGVPGRMITILGGETEDDIVEDLRCVGVSWPADAEQATT